MDNHIVITEAAEADLIEQNARVETGLDDAYPSAGSSTLEPGDPLLDVAMRLHADHVDATTLTDTIRLVTDCRDQLDVVASPAALPELVDRLARQRLTDHMTDRSAGAPGGWDAAIG